VILLGLGLVPLALVVLTLYADGPGVVPWIVLGGVLGEYGFHVTRPHLRKKVLAGTADPPNWISAGGPKIRKRLLRAYRPGPTVLLAAPYFVLIVAYGAWNMPWAPDHDWEKILGAVLVSALAAGGLANGIQWLYFGWLATHID
jgi:hypothetical protein